MNLVIAPRAEQDINNQIDYGVQKFGRIVAERSFERIFDFLENVLIYYPRSGNFDPGTRTYTSWIPRTPFVVLYKIDKQKNDLIVVALYHHAQDRSSFEPDWED